MRVGNFSVLIPQGVEKESGYVAITHGTQYSLKLMNHEHRKCDAKVEIDGKEVGTFRIRAGDYCDLETRPGDGGKFTFYRSGTSEAVQVGEGSIIRDDCGLVRVTFTPEKNRLRPGAMSMTSRSKGISPQSCGGFEEKTAGGITGMSGHSDQQFHNVEAIELDYSGQVTISLRLVALADGPRSLVPISRGNPVPPPVS